MANVNFQWSSAPLRTIQEIQFGLLSPEEIKNLSVAKIDNPDPWDEHKTRPRPGGLMDPRLGSIDRSFKCETCDEGMQECPGHFGHIDLAAPVFHIGFLTKVKKVLEIVCHSCGKIKVDESNPEFVDAIRQKNPKIRFERVWRLCKPKLICEQSPPKDENDGSAPVKPGHDGCGNAQPTIRKEGLKLVATWKPEKGDGDDDGALQQPEKKVIKPAQALQILRQIPDEDIVKMGLNKDYARPEWMILTVLPVPPPPVRPSVSRDGTSQGARAEDDLTYKLGDVLHANRNLIDAERQGSPQHVINQFEDLIQYHSSTYMDNDIAGQPAALQKSGRAVKSIRARLKGKEGRLRGNLMGKRVDFSARTVITGDPNLGLDEVGVPRSIARTLTYPETVTPYNIHKLHQLVKNGPNEHPGAKYVIRDTGERIDLKYHKRAGDISLQYGWKVERHVVDGDYVIFNRQPSLHKESMMGHRVRVMPYSTFRMNLSATSPYNADFDGDEMNLHVPQSEETRAEISQICMVPKQIVSPQRNSPLMGIVQDTLCGIYMITRRDMFLGLDQVMNIMLWIPDWDGILPPPAIMKPVTKWSGKQIISMAFNSSLNINKPDKGLSPLEDGGVCINGGELMFGLLNKSVVGASANGVIHITFNEKGPDAALQFFNTAQRIVAYFLLHHGFSIGIGDTIPDLKTVEAIAKSIDVQKREVDSITEEATANRLDPLPGLSVRATFESKVMKALNEARDVAGSACEKGLKDINNALNMAKSGSKGSTVNISQMSALVGQQAVEGKRIPFGFKYRSLPHFTKDDYSPESRGFVENSYLRGLTPTEFFFHAMAGREGLIDTAVKTAETGYIQRRLVKAMEDVQARYDGTVRNSLGDIVQFVYGEDGLDGAFIEKQKVDILTCSDSKFRKMVHVDVMSDESRDFLAELEHESSISGDPRCQAVFEEEYSALTDARAFFRRQAKGRSNENDEAFQIALNVGRMMEQASSIYKLKLNSRSDLDPLEAIPLIRNTLENLVVVRGDDTLSKEAQDNATMYFKAYLRSRLAFKRLVTEYNMNSVALRHVLGEIETKFLRAAVNPGEMVGVLAAQSIGEPATQMTLNTFHFTGIASKNVTLGVPRLKEILNVATNIKTPSMKVYQWPDKCLDKQAAQDLRSHVEHTSLRSVTATTEIYYDPDVQTTIHESDRDMVESYWIIPDDTGPPPEDQSRWVLRLVLDRRKLLDKSLTVSDVAGVIKDFFQGDLAILFSDNNAEEQVIRIRFVHRNKDEDYDDAGLGDNELLKKLENHMLNRLTVRGVPAVKRAFLDKIGRVVEEKDGSLYFNNDDPKCQEWILDTTGSSLRAVMNIPDVDSSRTYSNSLFEILDLLGIEATRTSLFKELRACLEFDGSYVNVRHIACLVDIMTARGWVAPVTRFGINRAETGALMRCSFEETVEILLEAAAAGELDDCRGVSENIMLGQLGPLGTGEMDVFLDQKMLDTVISDNSRLGIVPSMGMKGSDAEGAATPYSSSPLADVGVGYLGADYDAAFSPAHHPGSETPSGITAYPESGFGSGMSPYNPRSPGRGFSPASPFGGSFMASPGAASPMYSPSSPMTASPANFSPASPNFSPASPAFTPTSPNYSPTSPQQASPTSPNYSPTSPNFSPTSPSYSPTSPSYSPTSPAYSPTSPNYSPTSPAGPGAGRQHSPTSPTTLYSPTSPAAYSPTSPAGQYSPTSPSMAQTASPSQQAAYSPTSPTSPRES